MAGLFCNRGTPPARGPSTGPGEKSRNGDEQHAASAVNAGSTPAGPALKIAVLATSSAGNSTFVSDGTSRLLIDCGLSLLDTTTRLAAIGESVDNIDAVLLTHPHIDHCAGLATLIRRWRRGGRLVPVFCSWETNLALGTVIPAFWFQPIQQNSHWQVGEISCESFPVEHDTTEPLGFAVQLGKMRAAFALDLGKIGDTLGDYLADSDLVLLEANHDPDMLRVGPYAYTLKTRIALTHLSNEAVCEWIGEHMTHRTRHLLLGHLSETTNDPELVRLMARRELDRLELTAALDVISPGASSGPWLLPLERARQT